MTTKGPRYENNPHNGIRTHENVNDKRLNMIATIDYEVQNVLVLAAQRSIRLTGGFGKTDAFNKGRACQMIKRRGQPTEVVLCKG